MKALQQLVERFWSQYGTDGADSITITRDDLTRIVEHAEKEGRARGFEEGATGI